MICYPVVYTRTFKCDYYSKFHVLPERIDSTWLMPYIRSATSDLDMSEKKIKKVIISDSTWCVFGVITYAKNIYINENSEFTCDDKGRDVFGFYGFAAEVGEKTENIPVVKSDDLKKLYVEKIVPVWNDTVSETQEAIGCELETKKADLISDSSDRFVYKEIINIFSEEGAMYETLLLEALNGNDVNYCSYISDYKSLKKTPFNYVVTKANNIKRLEEEQAAEERKLQEEACSNRIVCNEADDNVSSQKKNQLDYDCSCISEEDRGNYSCCDKVFMQNGSFIHQENIYDDNILTSEESMRKAEAEILSVLKKYVAPAVAVAVSAAIVCGIVNYINAIKTEEKDNRKDENDAERIDRV